METTKNRIGSAITLIVETVKAGYRDNVPQWAASIAFFAFMSFTPLVFVSISIASLFLDASWVADQMSGLLSQFLPDESDQQVREFIDNAVAARGRIGFISFIAFFYTGTRVFAVLTRALHVVYDVESEQHFVRELLVQTAMLFTVGVAIVFALTSDYFYGLLSSSLEFLPGSGESIARNFISGTIQLMILVVALVFVYRFIPRNASAWRPALAGALMASLLLAIVRPVFAFYLGRFSEQNIIYGSLSSIVILLIWIWIGAIIVLFGGELAANMQRSTSSVSVQSE